MNINQLVKELERQKASLERAIGALKEVSESGFDAKALSSEPVSTTAAKSAARKRVAGKSKKPAYTDDYRRAVVSAVREGMTFGEAAKKFKTTWFSVREWANSGRFEPAGASRATGQSAPAKKAAPKKTAQKKAADKAAA